MPPLRTLDTPITIDADREKTARPLAGLFSPAQRRVEKTQIFDNPGTLLEGPPRAQQQQERYILKIYLRLGNPP
jgi:hypothetical protein